MKYKTIAAMHKRHAEVMEPWVWYPDNFKPKKEYTFYDFLSYIPTNIFYLIYYSIVWFYEHRPKLVIAKERGE